LNAGLRFRSGLRSTAIARTAITVSPDLDLALRPIQHIVEGDLQIDPQVPAATGTSAPGVPHSSKEPLEKRALENISEA
jgi:hypothetical protein